MEPVTKNETLNILKAILDFSDIDYDKDKLEDSLCGEIAEEIVERLNKESI